MAASEQLATFFESHLGIPVSRNQVKQIANQLDYMKRLRRNGGARDILHRKGIALLWGKGDRQLIAQLGLPPVAADEFVAYKPANAAEQALVCSHGHPII
jgi:hypothetical protein